MKLLKVKEFRRKDTTTIIANNETQILREVIIKSLTLKKEVISNDIRIRKH